MPLAPSALVLMAILLALGIDVVSDLQHGSHASHVALEIIAFSGAAVLLVAIVNTVVREKRDLEARLVQELGQLSMERDQWRERAGEYLRGLGAAIDKQFSDWGLSSSERDIALLILKGLSHKEIAVLRGTSEKTVRQQAGEIYDKSGLSGKGQLAAFFLEDLMLPKSS
ncbi:MAG: helix-turn-helix transcriptional regulator [Oligoflexia bacterium]|nr:helix-turn-helix transcriptional regulator [Oligoflexia bacterium]